MSTETQARLRAEAERARAELAMTLDAIEYKLNLRRQVDTAARRLSTTLRKLGEENPAGLAGVAAGAAVGAGSIVWLAARTVQGWSAR